MWKCRPLHTKYLDSPAQLCIEHRRSGMQVGKCVWKCTTNEILGQPGLECMEYITSEMGCKLETLKPEILSFS